MQTHQKKCHCVISLYVYPAFSVHRRVSICQVTHCGNLLVRWQFLVWDSVATVPARIVTFLEVTLFLGSGTSTLVNEMSRGEFLFNDIKTGGPFLLPSNIKWQPTVTAWLQGSVITSACPPDCHRVSEAFWVVGCGLLVALLQAVVVSCRWMHDLPPAWAPCGKHVCDGQQSLQGSQLPVKVMSLETKLLPVLPQAGRLCHVGIALEFPRSSFWNETRMNTLP